jgi:hypothetical protein
VYERESSPCGSPDKPISRKPEARPRAGLSEINADQL